MGVDYCVCDVCGDIHMIDNFARCNNEECEDKYICLRCYEKIEGHEYNSEDSHPDCCFCTRNLKKKRFTKDEIFRFILSKYKTNEQTIIDEMKLGLKKQGKKSKNNI